MRLHSTILQSMLEMGIGFIIVLGWYLFDIVKRSWKTWSSLAIPLTAMIIILTNGSVNFLIRIAPNAALVIVWLAVMELSLRKPKNIEQPVCAIKGIFDGDMVKVGLCMIPGIIGILIILYYGFWG